MCVKGCRKGDHFIHCRQVVSKTNLYTVGKLFLRVTVNIYTQTQAKILVIIASCCFFIHAL